MYGLWHNTEQLQYDKEKGEKGLSSKYISTFQGLKQESSDYPEWAGNEKT